MNDRRALAAAERGPRPWHSLLVLVPLAVTAWVYHPITRVFFFADDFIHLLRITRGPYSFLLEPFGGHNLLLRNVAFLVSWRLFGLHSEPWFWTVLLTHLVNVWLLFRVLGALTGSSRLACFGAAAWGILPLHLGTLAFYSVYGNALATTLLLVVLDGVARRRATAEPVTARTAALWYALLLAGTTCFGTGVGVGLVFPTALFLLLPELRARPRLRVAFLALPAVVAGLYVGMQRLYAAFRPMPDAEARIGRMALHHLPRAPLLFGHLWFFGITATMLGPFLKPGGFGSLGNALGIMMLPVSYPDAREWVCVGAFLGGLLLIAWRAPAAVQRTALAMLVLTAGSYLLIALGRAPFFGGSSRAAQAAAFLRYHYQASVPLTVLLCLVLGEVGRLRVLAALPGRVTLGLALAALVAAHVRFPLVIDPHPEAREYVAQAIEAIDAAARAAPPGSTVYVENDGPGLGLGNQLFTRDLPGRAGLFLLLSPSADTMAGRHVRFVERDATLLAHWRARPDAPLARLLVAPDQASR